MSLNLYVPPSYESDDEYDDGLSPEEAFAGLHPRVRNLVRNYTDEKTLKEQIGFAKIVYGIQETQEDTLKKVFHYLAHKKEIA